MQQTDETAAAPPEGAIERGAELAQGLTEGYLKTVDSVCAVPGEIADPDMVIYIPWWRLTMELI